MMLSLLLSIFQFANDFGLAAFAQTYPVQLSTQLIPPYSGYLPDYADPSSEKLRVVLQFNDFTLPQYNIRLKLEIKGNGFTLTTKQLYNPPPLILQPGVPLLLSGADLAPYLNSNNLDFVGINQSQYEQRMALPEGYYTICLKAYDYYNTGNIPVSNEACTQAWFTLSDPPFLNLPLCNVNVTPFTPQNILFQWTPMNLGSPNSALNTEYVFELWECRPDTNANPNQIALSTAPIYSIVTQQTLLNYGITEPALNLYMKYVWRVKAKDVSGRDLFKNQGYSQICTFNYGSVASVLGSALTLNLTAQSVTHRMGKCTWNTQSLFTTYKLQVRKQGTTNWFDYNTTQGSEKVTNLEPNTDYEAQVQGSGNGITSAWSNIATFKTNNEPNYNCNDQTQLADPLQAQPLPPNKALIGLIIQTGQFEVITTQITPTGAPGWYSGKGYAKVFGALPLAVQWSNIYIDDNNRHQQGVINAMTKGIDNWLHQWDVSQAQDNPIIVTGTITSFTVANGQYCYTLQGSSQQQCDSLPKGVNVVVVHDDAGNEYSIQLIPPPPTVTGPTNYIVASADNMAACDSLMVTFEANQNQLYGFDEKEYTANIPNYECIKLGNAQNYFVPYKSIAETQTDQVLANIQINNFKHVNLSFKTLSGTALTSASLTTTQYKITGIPASASCIYAYYNNKKVGKLNIVSLKPISKKLVIVPVNSTNTSVTASDINALYKQANVTWSVTTATSFTFNLGGDGLEAADATLLTKYSTEMRALRDAYKQATPNYDKDAYYIFVVPNFKTAQLKGYMVRGRAMGFITANANIKEVAHELAHGAFALEHTFPKIEQSTSNNLLDYGSGEKLTKEQWMDMQYPAIIKWSDSEEDGALNADDGKTVFTWINKIKKACGNGTSILLSTNISVRIENTFLAGVDFDYLRIVSMHSGTNIAMTPTKYNIVEDIYKDVHVNNDGESHWVNYPCLNIDNGKFIIIAPQKRLNVLRLYLESPGINKNLLLFVNGYRPILNVNGDGLSGTEYVNSNNQIEFGDIRGYWQGIDAQFINTINTRNAVYVDGHHSVSTSNHQSIANFTDGMSHSLNMKANCLHQGLCIESDETYLHKTPYTSGFTQRQNSGAIAANNLVAKINSGDIVFNKQFDSLDIVCHSMGYAYAMGMIQTLKIAGIKFGRCYIIAPENACSGSADWSLFTEVWQYGTNEVTTKPYLQDGVAPQCKVTGIDQLMLPTIGGRIYIPDDYWPKGFLDSHTIKNYDWIFNLKSGNGYVKKR